MTPLTRDTVLFGLSLHLGRGNGVSASTLVAEICGDTSPALERQLRHLIEEMRTEGEHICGHPSTGYYIAANDEELLASVKFLYDRAMTSLRQAAAMQRVSLPDIRGQLRIPLETRPAVSEPRPGQPAVPANNTGSQSLVAPPSTRGDLTADVDARDGEG